MFLCDIGNNQIKIKDGFTITDELNETLDSGTLQFVSLNGFCDIDPFDSAVIKKQNDNTFTRKKLLVDSYTAEIVKFNNSDINQSDFEYLVNLFSETKLLERITLPNLAITRRKSGTPRTVWEVIKGYCKRYLPMIKIYTSTNKFVYRQALKYDDAMETKFNMECPEFVWNTPTLKEVLMDLMSVADCIPVVKDNVLTFFDLSQKGNQIDTTKITNVQISATSADYCDNLTLPMKNVISKQPVVATEILSLRSPSAELTSNNAVFMTKKPIYKIKKATLFVYGKVSYTSLAKGELVVSADITNQIIEKERFDLLSNNFKVFNKDAAKTNRCGNLYFERGDNKIQNFGTEYKIRTISGAARFNRPSFAYIAAIHLYEQRQARGEYANWNSFANEFADTYFYNNLLYIEYETYDDLTISVSKEDKIKNPQNSLFDSQSANAVDLVHQTVFEYAKANRLASKIITIYGEYTDENDIPQLSDYIGEKILYHREITYYDHIYFFKGMLCDNYVLRDYFTGINAKERSWNIADSKEAIIRNDIYRFFINFDTKQTYEKEFSGTFQSDEMPYKIDFSNFLNSFVDFKKIIKNYGNYGLRSACCESQSSSGTRFPQNTSKYGVVALTTYATGKIICYCAALSDNMSLGDETEIDEDDNKPVLTMEPVPYVDGNGETSFYRVIVDDIIDISKDTTANYEAHQKLLDISYPNSYNEGIYNNIGSDSLDVPRITYAHWRLDEDENGNGFEVIAQFPKDNREILSSTIQFEYVSNSDDIFVYDGIAEIMAGGSCRLNPQNATNDWKQNIGVKALTTDGDKYERGNTTPRGVDVNLDLLSIDAIPNNRFSAKISIQQNPETVYYQAWCIYSKITGKILLAVNGTLTAYANLNYTRDDNIYNNVLDKKVIGKVYDSQSQLNTNYANTPSEVSEVKLYNRTITSNHIKDFI